MPQTTLDFTGQQRDGTGLLSYGARSYDAGLGLFLSADALVPGAASGAGGAAATVGYDDGVALGPLTVGFQEPGFAAALGEENRLVAGKGFFDSSQKPRTGPANPQALNRYAYVLNNPVRYTDPDGHCGPACVRLLEKLGELIGRYGPRVVAWVARILQRLAPMQRIIEHASGARLDTTRISIPGPVNSPWGKLDYLLGRVTSGPSAQVSAGKGGFFEGVMKFTRETLDASLRSHLAENFQSATINQRGYFEVVGEMTGPTGVSARVITVWQKLEDGTFAFITAHPS